MVVFYLVTVSFDQAQHTHSKDMILFTAFVVAKIITSRSVWGAGMNTSVHWVVSLVIKAIVNFCTIGH